MPSCHWIIRARILLGILTVCFVSPGRMVRADEAVDFGRDIQPLIAKHCVLCHGPDQSEGGLRLDDPDAATSQLDSGNFAIRAGDPASSVLLDRVTTDDESLRMPPEGDPLGQAEIEKLRAWIADGAEFKTHWAYLPVAPPVLPKVRGRAWICNPIDRYVLAKLEQVGVTPSPEAEPATLVKRLSYDLIGLPPEIEWVDQFAADPSELAYETLVDQLLSSVHFGERWGRHWLDKARYADSDGYEKDRPRPHAWRYRDWVIDAINTDLPFDQFTIEQLAGDLLADPTPMQRLATAFHRQTLTNTEGGTDQEEFRVEATFDRTETTGAIWLGLTMTCARCHTHKYDQITQHEYYQLFAFFDDVNETEIDVIESDVAMQAYLKAKQLHDDRLADMTLAYQEAIARGQDEIEQWIQSTSKHFNSQEAAEIEFDTPVIVSAKAKSKATLESLEDGSLLVAGNTADTDEYTLIIELPEQPLTGIRLDFLPDDSLGGKGPGRTKHGNFVLSEVRAHVSRDKSFKSAMAVELVTAEADYSQNRFSPAGALSGEPRSGWAISPKMGKPHHWIGFTREPLEQSEMRYLRIVLDQQYGSGHTIGRFRVSTANGFDLRRALPKTIAAALAKAAGKRSAAEQAALSDFAAASIPEIAKLKGELDELRHQAPDPPLMKVAVLERAERTTRLLERGDFLQPADEVSSDILDVVRASHPLRPRHADQPADRLDLARWLADKNHPLSTRAAVNQVWAHLFGTGLVSTLNDFGVRGEQPTHPELLDFLAWQFPRQMQWSRKTLIKSIVMSATYRQASTHRDSLRERDPTNRLLARQNRVRVSAEVVRDLNLAVSGLLCRKVGGPSVFPPLPPGVAELSYNNNFKWETSPGEDAYRRGLYTFFKRTSPHPTLISFDCPDSNTTQLQREVSNTPLQALVTLNNEVFSEAAEAFAGRVLAEGGEDDRERLAYGLRLCLARMVSDQEIDLFEQLLEDARDYYRHHPTDAYLLTQRHRADNQAVEEHAAWVATVRMILNLDEFIVRE